MANLTIEMPDDLARSLENMAAAQRISVQQLAIERLSALVYGIPEPPVGTAAALLRALRQEPHVSASDVAELEAAIAAGRLPVQAKDFFSE